FFGQFVSVSACPTCGGEGTVIQEPCEQCHGDGRVRAERTVEIEIPAGVSANNYLTLRGQGAAGARSSGPGDLIVAIGGKGRRSLAPGGRGHLHVRIQVWTPQRLNAEHKELFDRLADIESKPQGDS